MKHTTLISVAAAVSIASCDDATAPQPRATLTSAPLDAAFATVADSSELWTSLSLDDAATRLLSEIPDGNERNDLKRALHALSVQLVRRDNEVASRANQELAQRALAQLRKVSDSSALPDLDAIALALDGAVSFLDARSTKER